jgi:pimeloyl-ACP methyl ester carboxylesterase
MSGGLIPKIYEETMARGNRDHTTLAIEETLIGKNENGYTPVEMKTNHGDLKMRYYQAAGAVNAAIFVGGIGGDWDTPAIDLYPRAAEALLSKLVSSLRIQFRYPTNLDESVLDVLAGATFLEAEGIDRLALAGHSFGGAVVIRAAAVTDAARTVITLASQAYGAETVGHLPLDCSILLIHGARDEILSPDNSAYIYQLAHDPKKLVVLEGAGHSLQESAAEVQRLVLEWLTKEIGPGRAANAIA